MSNQLVIILFYVLGILVFLPPLIVTWVAIEDILTGSTLPSSIVVLASTMDIVGKFMAIHTVNRLPLSVLMIFHSFSSTSGLVVLVLLNVNLRIIGVIIIGYSSGFGIVLYLRQSANFDASDKLSSAFVSGSNTAALLASLFYTGLTTWTCVAPRTALASCIPLCLITLAFYPFLANKTTTSRQKIETSEYHTVSQTPTSKDTGKSSTTTARILFFLLVFPFGSYLFLANFSHTISITSILTTLTFPSSPFLPRDHYQYYPLVSDVGVAFGNIEVFVSFLSRRSEAFLRIRRVWVLVILQASFTVFFLFASWFRFLPNVYTLFVLVFAQGILYGMISINSIALVSNHFNNAKEKGAAMGYAEVACSIGRLVAGLLGVFIEQVLRRHCTNSLLLGRYCIARVLNINGWETNVHC